MASKNKCLTIAKFQFCENGHTDFCNQPTQCYDTNYIIRIICGLVIHWKTVRQYYVLKMGKIQKYALNIKNYVI